MTRTVEIIINEARAKVYVACCEYHAHSAKADCLSGPQEAIDICILGEEISRLRGQLNEIAEITSRRNSN
jgi:hypothetical protein